MNKDPTLHRLVYVTVADTPAAAQRLPRWKRTIIIDEDDNGTIYFPVETLGAFAWLCACMDGVRMVLHCNHPFVPLEWCEQEYPDHCDLYAAIRRHAAAARKHTL